MGLSKPLLATSENTCDGYFWSYDPTSTEVWGLSCSGGRKVVVVFDGEKDKQEQYFWEIHLLVNAILTGSSLIHAGQLKGLKKIQFHKCTAHKNCRLPSKFEKKLVSCLLPKKVENCTFCCEKGREYCVYAQWCLSEDEFFNTLANDHSHKKTSH